jgi:hypothetical protein
MFKNFGHVSSLVKKVENVIVLRHSSIKFVFLDFWWEM